MKSTSFTQFIKKLGLEGRMAAMPCRLFPSSFDPTDPEMTAIPRPLDWRWSSCERMLRYFGAKTVMLQLPNFWQVESYVHAACKNVGASLFPNEPENMPVGAAAIRSGEANVVIAEADHAATFASFLSDRGALFPEAWITIHQPDAASWVRPARIQDKVAHEIHLFPGMPILEQCEQLANNGRMHFHLSDDFIWEIFDDRAQIANKDEEFPFTQLELPFLLREIEVCTCDKKIYERRV